MSQSPCFPVLRESEHAVVCAEHETGIVLALDGTWATEQAERYRVFATREEAGLAAAALVQMNTRWEAAVLDATGAMVGRFVTTRAEPRPVTGP